MSDTSTMTERWLAAIADSGSSGARDHELDAAAAALGIKFPEDYRDLMRHANGGEGEFGDSWIRLWRAEDLCERNPGLEIPGYAAGFTFFGTNGGGEAYAWDWRPERRSRYVVIPFIVPDPDVAVPCGDTLEEFLAVLHGGIPFGG